MKNNIKSLFWLISFIIVILVAGCEQSDECEENGWYGDGECDTFCPEPDPDCDDSPSTTTTSVIDSTSTTTIDTTSSITTSLTTTTSALNTTTSIPDEPTTSVTTSVSGSITTSIPVVTTSIPDETTTSVTTSLTTSIPAITTTSVSTTSTVFDDSPVRTFWVDDLEGNSGWQEINVTRLYQTDRVNVWVRDEDVIKISQDLIEHYGDFFTEHSWPDVTTYVYEIVEYFDVPGNRINILFYTADPNLAGYFWSKDFYNDDDAFSNWELRSNETNIFYMNIDAAVSSSNQQYATLFTEGTLTHEFQHMCQAHYFIDNQVQGYMDSWANETCSVLMETIFAGQSDIYIPSYNNDSDDKFSEGQVRILKWDNDFNQYIMASLFGTFVLSQIESSKQSDFISTWLKNTPAGNTSVHDIVVTLEDSTVSYWTSTTSPTDDNGIQQKWSELLGAFVKAVAGNNSAYTNFIDSISTNDINPVITSAGAKTLETSAWVIAEVNASDLSSTSGCDSGSVPAYMIAYHNGLPAWTNGSALTLPSSATTCSIAAARAMFREDSNSDYLPYTFNRSMSAFNKVNKFMVTPFEKPNMNQKGIVNGGIQYFYVER